MNAAGAGVFLVHHTPGKDSSHTEVYTLKYSFIFLHHASFISFGRHSDDRWTTGSLSQEPLSLGQCLSDIELGGVSLTAVLAHYPLQS